MNNKQNYIDKITGWSIERNGEDYLSIERELRFLEDYLYYDFEPALNSQIRFNDRLNLWLDNVKEETFQKLLLKLVPKIFYIGREEFNCLYKTVFSSNIKNWLVECVVSNFETEDYNLLLSNAINETWFCPITDSFRINQFYHLNNISSKHTFRPDWRSLKKFGDLEKISNYIRSSNVKYIVLLEDFVGSGTQSESVIKFANQIVDILGEEDISIKLLICPLIICPIGIDKLSKLCHHNENIDLSSVIQISENELINEERIPEQPELIPTIQMIKTVFPIVIGTSTKMRSIGMYGYKDTGSLVVMYTNTPNNSLPIIYAESNTWFPLFKRHFRD